MSLTPTSYLLSGLILLGGIDGQWAGKDWIHLWCYPAAFLILLFLLEGLLARDRV